MARPPKELHPADRAQVGFIFLGGAHQVLHIAPVAAELALGGSVRVVAYVGSQAEREMLERVLRAYGDPPLAVNELAAPGWARAVAKIWPRWSTLKLPRLFMARRGLGANEALVMAERTSTVLRHWLSPVPALIHIPHGAGDRAKGFERRLSHFDLVIVAGEKDRRRMIDEGVVDANRVVVGGSPKLGSIERLTRDAGRLFAGARPVVLYNPHFDPRVGSWSRFGEEVIAHLAGSNAFDLVVAPHIRLFEHAPEARRHAIEALAVAGHVRVDLGSPASSDMTYTAQADIYLGDVSSQVYEFTVRPRPCVFLNAHRVNWRDDPNYLFWHMGEVIDDIADLLPALARAPARFEAQYRAMQVAMAEQTFGADIRDAPARVADLVLRFVEATSASQKRRIALAPAGTISRHRRDPARDEHRGTL